MNSRLLLLNEATERLTQAGVPQARLDAQWMLAHALGMPRLEMLCDPQALVPERPAAAYARYVALRADGVPLQYVLGEAAFMGHIFRVNASVLIPRSDTESLCEAALERVREGRAVLDIGTGSGALAISIALACPKAHVEAADISREALAVAQENARRLDAPVTFFQSDLFDALAPGQYDVIVSNPPYIRTEDLLALQREVRAEPRLALDGGPDGLAFYRRIVSALPQRLRAGGSLLLEVGDGQAEPVAEMLADGFDQVYTRCDLQGLKRVVAGDGYAG